MEWVISVKSADPNPNKTDEQRAKIVERFLTKFITENQVKILLYVKNEVMKEKWKL